MMIFRMLGIALFLGLAFMTVTVKADDITSQSGYVLGELIFPLDHKPTPSCHASTLVHAADGTLVAAWFGGTREGNPDVGIWVSRDVNGTWTQPIEAANGVMSPEKRYPCWNPVLFRLRSVSEKPDLASSGPFSACLHPAVSTICSISPASPSLSDEKMSRSRAGRQVLRQAPRTGPLVLFFKVGPSPKEWWGERVLSYDNGKTWVDQRKLPSNVVGPIKDKPILLKDGTILCGSSNEFHGWVVHMELTRDLKHWSVVGPLNDPNTISAIQPTILQYRDGRVQILCRTQKKFGFIAQSWSHDQGRSWSPLTRTSLPNPNSGIDAVTLRDGRQLLVYNPSSTSRIPLAVALSRDGTTWKKVMTLEHADAVAQNSYPAVIQTSDGRVHISYTYHRLSIKHVVLDPGMLK